MPTSFRVLKFYPLWIMGGLIAVWFGWAWWMFAGLFISCLGLYYTALLPMASSGVSASESNRKRSSR